MGHLLMSTKERERLKVLARVKKSEMKLKEAAELLGVSYRQAKRQYGRYREEGDKGLVHRGRGRAGNRGYSQDFKKKVIARYQERYPDFGPTLAAEKLEEDGYKLNPETLRLWLVEAGIWQKRRKRAAHRSWRERRAHFGEMLQLDGSHHRWFEERGEKSCLMNLVDDATGTTLSFFAKEETTEAAMILLWAWIDKYGIPAAIYVDRKNVYVPDEKQVLEAREEGREHYTQFGRACAQLGIRVIKAYSPQAKGRVERSHGVYQDRLVKELRLKKINSIESANQLLSSGFTDNLNRKFAIQAREAADYHRNSKGYDLASIFCIEEDRTLTDDWIVRFNNDFYQLQRQSNASPTSKKVKVRQYLNGEIRFSYRGKETNYEKLVERPQSKAEAPSKKICRPRKPRYSPPPNHPWRG